MLAQQPLLRVAWGHRRLAYYKGIAEIKACRRATYPHRAACLTFFEDRKIAEQQRLHIELHYARHKMEDFFVRNLLGVTPPDRNAALAGLASQ